MRRASEYLRRLGSISIVVQSRPFQSTLPFSYSTSSYLQLVPDSRTKTLPGPLYSFLPGTQNPNNLVYLICSALKRGRSRLRVLQRDAEGLIPYLCAEDISGVLLRCQSNSSQALAFFDWLKDDLGIKPSTQNYCLMLLILGWSKNYASAMRLTCELIEIVKDCSVEEDDIFQVLLLATDVCNWEPVNFDILVRAYLKLGMIEEGFKNFMNAVKVGFVLNVITCNHLLNGLLKSKQNDLCWRVYEIMSTVGIHPNTHTFNILTNVFCEEETNLCRVNEFLEKMEEEGFEPDLVTYNTLISRYCSKGRLNEAFYLYKIMYRRGVVPDLYSYKALIRGLCKESRMKEAQQLFHRLIHRRLQPDVTLYNILVYGYSKEGRIEESKSLLYEMLRNGVHPDGFTCKTVVEGYVKDGRLVTALNFVNDLWRCGISICNEVYDFIIVTLCKEGKPFAAKNLMERLIHSGYAAGADIYDEVIESLCKTDSLSNALILVDKAKDAGVKLNFTSYRTLICTLCRENRNRDAELLMDEMLGLKILPDAEICRALISSYCKESEVQKAESILGYFAKEFKILDTESYNTVVKSVCESGNIPEMMELQERLQKFGFLPNSLTCKYVIQGLCRGTRREAGFLQ